MMNTQLPITNNQMTSKPFRILFADDDTAILELYRDIFTLSLRPGEARVCTQRFEPVFCESAEEALKTVRSANREKKPFALAFLDVNMPPGRDGVWAAEQIRMLDPDIVIALVTGYFSTDLGKVGKRIPPPDKLLYLQKPVAPKEILQLAASMCAKWQTEKELRRIHAHLETLVNKRTSALEKANEKLAAEIKKRGKVENALRTSETNFRNMIRNSGDSLLIIGKDMLVRFVNPAATLLFGKAPRDLIGTPFGFSLVAGKTTELDIVRKSGDLAVVEMSVARTEWEGGNAHLASLRDITKRKRIQAKLQESLKNTETALKGTIQTMSKTVGIRDPYTAGHQQRVAALSKSIAEEMGMAPDFVEGVWLAGLVHDIGKISVPAEILSKPGRLTEIEFALLKAHPEDGYDILKDIPFPWPIAQSVRQHHERANGSGYPQGLSGREIILEARILCVADVVEAMSSHRPYRAAIGIDNALEEVLRNRGRLYDQEVVHVCLKLFREKSFAFPENDPIA